MQYSEGFYLLFPLVSLHSAHLMTPKKEQNIGLQCIQIIEISLNLW